MSSSGLSSVQKVEEYKSSVIKKAEDIVRNKFPDHILRFNEMLEQPPFKCDDLTQVHSNLHISVPNSYTHLDVYLMCSIEGNGEKGSKKRCMEQEEEVLGCKGSKKRCMEQEEEQVSGCKVYLLPLGTVPINTIITNMVDTIKPFIRDLVEEANLVAKYPHIADYRRAVCELDEKQFLGLRITLAEIRNHYASLHDMINKNLEKIKKPRSLNSHETMY
ncbi:proteasome activator complex subunit 3-like [Hyalella azteca]|uniref:Proteasome activator complex subunit 3-like n=1 Tax=Hyalella azteca TaxID=294128 RepID=A0A8B7NYT8_HYAAZ|nr:proteasome activator complex subunit 3-like [Hyalella azteca]